MTNKPENPPAFPHAADSEKDWLEQGMTLRDYFAGQVLAGVMSSYFMLEDKNTGNKPTDSHVAGMCYQIADAMLEERNKDALLQRQNLLRFT